MLPSLDINESLEKSVNTTKIRIKLPVDDLLYLHIVLNRMSTNILIAGSHFSLGKLLAEIFINKGHSVLACGRSSTTLKEHEVIPENYTFIPWNESSFLGTKNVLLTGINTCGDIDDAFIVFEPEVDTRPFHDLPTSVISLSVDTFIKGYLFLIKELLRYFIRRKKGSLSLILYSGGHDLLPPINSALISALRETGQTLMQFYQNEPIAILGFESSSTNREDFVNSILKLWEDRTKPSRVKWIKYTDKTGLFQNLSLPSFKK